MERTDTEQSQLGAIHDRLSRLHAYLRNHHIPEPAQPAKDWFAFLSEIKAIVGNASNDHSFVACLMAKNYLQQRFAMQPFDVAIKPQGANGFDIDATTTTGERIVAEIKTTSPVLPTNFGANQRRAFIHDIAKLSHETAAFRFFFVTDLQTYAIVQNRDIHTLEDGGIEIVLLTD